MLKGKRIPLTGDLVDRLREALNITGGDTCHRNSSIFRGIHRVLESISCLSEWPKRLTDLFSKLVHLLGFQTCVGKHADLCFR